ncbi:hypothetical protein HS125_10320 [bacterium]|nr:hypothetical protein [bacterium]
MKGAERVETVPGEALAGMSYEPLFPYFQDTPNGFQVVVADFVSTEDGRASCTSRRLSARTTGWARRETSPVPIRG